jgi:hypothetical protein
MGHDDARHGGPAIAGGHLNRVHAGVKELNEMTIGRADDPVNPLVAAAFEAASVFGTGSRTPSGPAVSAPRRQGRTHDRNRPARQTSHFSLASKGPSTHATRCFDPSRITYRALLDFFFQVHDPSTLNRQGNDRGASYRSAIFYTNEDQRQTAANTIADVDASGLWPGKVVTEVAPAGDFWEAEPEHQDYLDRIPHGYTCHFVRPDWKLPQRANAA